MKDIRLEDGSLLAINVNFYTIYLLKQTGTEKLLKRLEKKPNDENLQMQIAGNLIYIILRSNGKKVDEEEAMMLVPADEDAIEQLFVEFTEKADKIKKKRNVEKATTK